jgi:hypothetical protein
MNFNSLIEFCKYKYPEKSIELCEGIDLIIDTLNNIKAEIGKSVYNLFSSEELDIDSIDKYKNHAKQIEGLIKSLNGISNNLMIDNNEETEDANTYEDSNEEKINYNDKSFDSDINIPHTLYEDFTYTKPAGIEIEGVYFEATEWKDIFNKCCQYLLNKNPDIFLTFLNDQTMQGRKRKYFSYDSNEFRDPVYIKGSDIYIENNVNAIFVRNIIIKMLEKYEIPKRNCHIFIRRDLTSLHTKYENSKQTVKELEETDNEIKIGQYAKEFFTKYFQDNISDDCVQQFTDKTWCHDTFGIRYPILKQVDINLPIGEQVKYNNEYRRYYVNPVLNINEKNYIICSQWYPQFKPKLIAWIEEQHNKYISEKPSSDLIVRFDKKYSSICLPKTLFIFILKMIAQYKDDVFETGRLTSNLEDLIHKQTNYKKPQHVINNIRKFLEDQKIIALSNDSKKGRYIITDMGALQKLIRQYSNNQDDEASYITNGCKVVLYSYYDKMQLTAHIGDLNDKFLFLHNDCIGKKAGERFVSNAKNYVVVNFKKMCDT